MEKKVEIVFGKQPQVVEKIVKVPVRVNPKTTAEIIGDCIFDICAFAFAGGLIYGFYKLCNFKPYSSNK